MWLNPHALWLLTLAIPLTALFLYRRRAVQVRVPSLRFWLEAGRPRKPRALGRYLSHIPTWLASLVILGLLTAALAGPVRPDAEHRELMLVIDAGATMQSIESDGQTRLQLAQEWASRTVEQAPPGALISVIRAGARAEPRIVRSRDPVEVNAVIRSIDADDAEGLLGPAIELASSLATLGRQTRVVVFTDTGNEESVDVEERPVHLEWHRIGHAKNGLSIVGLDRVGRKPAVRVVLRSNSSPVPDMHVVLSRAEHGKIVTAISERTVPLVTDRTEIVFDVSDLAPGTAFHVQVYPTDALPLDNEAWGVWPQPQSLRILLVTNGNPFLLAALRADPDADVAVVRPNEWNPSDTADLVVFDNVLLRPTSPVAGRYLLFGCPDPFGWTGVASHPSPPDLAPTNWQGGHPALQDVDLSTWQVAGAAGIEPEGPYTSLVASGDTDLLFEVRWPSDGTVAAEAKALYFNFALGDSNLVLRPTFPVLLWNAIGYLLDRKGDETLVAHKSGTSFERSKARFRDPQLEDPTSLILRRLDAGDRWRWVDTGHQGLYRLRGEAGGQWVAFTAFVDTPSDSADDAPEKSELRDAFSVARAWQLAGEWFRKPWRILLLAGTAFVALEWLMFRLNVLRL